MTDFKRWLTLLLCIFFVWMLFLLSHVFVPFFVAAFFAFLGVPIVERLCWLKIPRVISVLIVFLVFAIIIAALLLWLIPLAANQFVMLMKLVPAMVHWTQTHVVDWVNLHLGMHEKLDANAIQTYLSAGNVAKAGQVVKWMISTFASSGIMLVDWAINLILIPVVTFYLMRDWPLFMANIKSALPVKHRATIVQLATQCRDVLSAFFRGQFLIMLAQAIIYSIGLSIVGLNFALVIGIIAGIISVIPYLGTIIGVTVAVITAIFQFHDITSVVWVLVVFGIGEVTGDMILTPLLIGHRIGLHPVAVIFAVLSGGVLFGFFGVLLALPVAAVIMVLLRYYKQQHLGV